MSSVYPQERISGESSAKAIIIRTIYYLGCMALKQPLLLFTILLLVLTCMSSCVIGMLLFYRDSKTATVYRSSDSNTDYFIIQATTLSHCGCTHLYVDNYKNGRKEFQLFYSDQIARKAIFLSDGQTNAVDTLWLMATPQDDYTTSFDTLDVAIFSRIDSMAVHKPEGVVYPIKRVDYKGFIKDPYYHQ